MSWKHKDRHWNPYLAGALAGLLALASAYATTKVMGKTTYLGSSSTYVRAAAMVERAFLPKRVAQNEYFKKEKVRIDWQFMLVCGIFAGALASALTGGAFDWESVPPLWHKRFGPNVFKRILGAFVGGVVAMFGARLADGCPSGHGLSGVMQLSVSGLVAMACFFFGGSMVAKFIAKRGNLHE